MLLGSAANHDNLPETESLVFQLILQRRYAEVYQLLASQQPASTSALYNIALCLHWSGNFQEALDKLESIRLAPQVNNQQNSSSKYIEIKSKQNQTDDYLQAISEAYVKAFPAIVYDAVVRLKTDCWLQMGNYAKVIAIAAPIAHKGYKNITDAINLAQTANDPKI